MKQIITAIVFILIAANITAQPFPVKLYEVTSTAASNGFYDNKVGKELNDFKVPDGANAIQMRIQVPVTGYKKVTAKYQVRLWIAAADNGVSIQNNYWNPLTKDTTLFADCFFPAGDYNISLVDNNDPSIIFAKRSITVKPNGSATSFSANGFSYDRSKFKIWTCESVDTDKWQAIGQTNKINAGSCITFFFDSREKIKNPGTMRWKIYKVDDDGKEVFVNQKDQNSVLPEWRRMYYEECDEFRTPGKYRVCFAIKNESEAYYGVKDKDFFATADVVVE